MTTVLCPDCGVRMKNHHSGVIVCETYLMPPKPYKLWSADLMICPNCGKQVVTGFGAGPISSVDKPDFRLKMEASFRPNYFWNERAGLTCEWPTLAKVIPFKMPNEVPKKGEAMSDSQYKEATKPVLGSQPGEEPF